MGKIRIKTIGDEEAEKQQKKEAKKRAEEKKKQHGEENAEKVVEESRHSGEGAEATDSRISSEQIDPGQARMTEVKPETDAPKKKPMVKKGTKGKTHSENYLKKASLVEKNKAYKLSDAVALLPKLTRAKFDETVELHINTTDKGISGQMSLPHGTGKQIRVEIINPTEDATATDELIKQIEAGAIDFDVLIATPDAMPRLARVARILGPRGLMPNPKNGTVTPKPEEIAKKFAGGQFHYKTEAKFPLLHLTVGKISFGETKLEENIRVALKSVSPKNIKNVTLKSTMSPGIKLDFTSV